MGAKEGLREDLATRGGGVGPDRVGKDWGAGGLQERGEGIGTETAGVGKALGGNGPGRL